VQISSEELLAQTQTNSHQLAEDRNFVFRNLPERLHFYLYEIGNSQPYLDAQGNIPSGIGRKIVGFDRIIATGIRQDSNPEIGSEQLSSLLKNHQYHDGIGVLDYKTATNNFEKVESGFSTDDEYNADKHYDWAVNGQKITQNKSPQVAAKILSHNLGVSLDSFEHFQNALWSPPPLNKLYQKATWFSLGANTLDMLFGNQISNEEREKLWEYYSNYVFARGPYPSLKVGNQPYPILPVMAIRNSSMAGTPLMQKLHKILSNLFEAWLAIVNKKNREDIVPRMDTTDDPFQTLLDILSMQPGSSDFQVQIKNYIKLHRILPTWMQDVADIPTSLYRLPVTQIYELLFDQLGLEKDQDPNSNILIKGDLAHIQKNKETLLSIISENIIQSDQFQQAPLFSFKQGKTEQKTLDNLNLALTEEDFAAFAAVLNEMVFENREKIIYYNKSEFSLFVDLILRAFTRALSYYNRIVYFRPTNVQLKGFKKLRINAIKAAKNTQVNNGTQVVEIMASKTDDFKNDLSISIIAPFKGKIDHWYIKEKQEIEAGQALFKLLDKTKFSKTLEEIKSLGKAIIEINGSFVTKKSKEEAQLNALKDSIDLNSHRLDAWLTGLATYQIDQLRQQSKGAKGLLTGVYGWVEHLRMDTEQTVSLTDDSPELVDKNRVTDGGIIHCPSPAQAMTATLFKNSFLSYQDKEALAGNPFTLHLSSDRIQKSNRLMEGIRQDQSIEALLGYRLEKDLQEAGLQTAIYTLRKHFPLKVNIVNQSTQAQNQGFTELSVINGLMAIEYKDQLPAEITPTQQKHIQRIILSIEAILDGSLDNLFFEAGYQLVQGNISRSAAAMEAAKGALAPPETRGIKTHLSGTGIEHQLALIFPPVTSTFSKEQAKAYGEPVLESWLQNQFGTMNTIQFYVKVFSEDIDPNDSLNAPIDELILSLAQLNISYLDFIYLPDTTVNTGVNELETRIWKYVKRVKNYGNTKLAYKITPVEQAGFVSLTQALEIKTYIKAFLNKCRPLKSADLTEKETTPTLDLAALNQISVRLDDLLSTLKNYKTAPIKNLEQLAQFDLLKVKERWLYGKNHSSETLITEIQTLLSQVNQQFSEYKT